MRKSMKWIMALLILTGMLSICSCQSGPEAETEEKPDKAPVEEADSEGGNKKAESVRSQVRIEEIDFTRISGQEIQITWSDRNGSCVEEYEIKRRKSGETGWETIAVQDSGGNGQETGFSYTDVLEDSAFRQYEYRVDVKVKEDEMYEAVEGKPVLASNILICIDPGHYEGKNALDPEGTAYTEGDFTLELALELRKILKETYGITACLTRESGTVNIGGYENDILDGAHIHLRGEYARGSDLFLSLHTNANLEGANGYGTISQPIQIMKPVIIANTIACDSSLAIHVGNRMGSRLAEAGARMEIAVPGKFREVSGKNEMIPWTDAFNDSLEQAGTICYRTDGNGDYYGVLRGAANVGVPGMIIEHGFHTVPRMRELAAQGTLKEQWAFADAQGIAEGFGLEKGMEE